VSDQGPSPLATTTLLWDTRPHVPSYEASCPILQGRISWLTTPPILWLTRSHGPSYKAPCPDLQGRMSQFTRPHDPSHKAPRIIYDQRCFSSICVWNGPDVEWAWFQRSDDSIDNAECGNSGALAARCAGAELHKVPCRVHGDSPAPSLPCALHPAFGTHCSTARIEHVVLGVCGFVVCASCSSHKLIIAALGPGPAAACTHVRMRTRTDGANAICSSAKGMRRVL